jgi:hypothetical protein
MTDEKSTADEPKGATTKHRDKINPAELRQKAQSVIQHMTYGEPYPAEMVEAAEATALGVVAALSVTGNIQKT